MTHVGPQRHSTPPPPKKKYFHKLPDTNDYFSLNNSPLQVTSFSPASIIDPRYQIFWALTVSSKKSEHRIDFPLMSVLFIPMMV